MKYWAIEKNGELIVKSVTGFKPLGAIAEVPIPLLNKAIKIVDGKVEYDPAGQQVLDTIKAINDAAKVQEDKVQKRLGILNFGQRMKAEIAVLNLDKGWDQDTFNSYILEPAVQQISSLLSDGFLETARFSMANADLSDYYTQEDIDGLLAKMDAHLGA